MSEVFKITLSLSCAGTLLIFIFLLCHPLLRRRLSKQWQYYIWLVVIARLLFPFAPEKNIINTLFRTIESGIEIDRYAVSLGQDTAYTSVTPEDPVRNWQDDLSEGQSLLRQGEQGLRDKQAWKASGFAFGLCWLVIALILLVRKITIYQSFVKYIKAGCFEEEDIGLLEQFGKLVGQSGIRTKVELSTNRLISSPLLIGFFRPCIVLPTDRLSEAEFQYTILHELTHYKRRDMFYKWLVQFTICVHWFNPMVYLMGREVERACELACDEAVVRDLNARERRAYGDTLLHAAGRGGSYKNSIASVKLGESKERLEERLDAIAGFHKKSKYVGFITGALTVAACFGAAAVGAYAVPAAGYGAAPLTKQQAIGPLTLTTKEYTPEELRELTVTELYITLYSDDVSVIRGGNTLKFEYYALNPEEYVFENPKDYINDVRMLSVWHSPSDVGGGRSMTITIPEWCELDELRISTTSGRISLRDCTANSIQTSTQTGEITVQGGFAAESFSIDSITGDALVSGMDLPDSADDTSYCSHFRTESGTVTFQPADSKENYCLLIDYGDDAGIYINGERIQAGHFSEGGNTAETTDAADLQDGDSAGAVPAEFLRDNEFTWNENATTKIKFISQRGTLLVQEK